MDLYEPIDDSHSFSFQQDDPMLMPFYRVHRCLHENVYKTLKPWSRPALPLRPVQFKVKKYHHNTTTRVLGIIRPLDFNVEQNVKHRVDRNNVQ